MIKIAQACQDAQDHVNALLGKDEAEGAAHSDFTKQDPAVSLPRMRTGENPANEPQAKGLEKAAADSASAIARVAGLEQNMVGLRAEIKSDLEDLGQALANVAAALDKLNGDATHKAARTAVPVFTVTKEDDKGRVSKADEDGKSVHELLKLALQNPQRASHYLR